MNKLTIERVIVMHKKLIATSGGDPGIRDFGLLESAVLGCYQSFNGQELYPTVIEKAARMAYAINKNHALVDGNKRTAVLSMLTILRMHNIGISYTQQELIELGFGIADGSLGYDEILAWINAHLTS
ncbi:MAG: type II toxin-antitoxin system death-on-curing family toxin [Defluviitaleaceae bacterium]|nr:type II toxin-antitoxin system death-on-curing family toxin [Defluviitaleaceae bacterium]